MNDSTELLKGVLEGCVLEIISKKQTYGYEIRSKLQEIGFKDIVEGTVYTILSRIEKNELVDIERKPSDKGPARKYYTLSEKGRQELTEFWEKWSEISQIMKIIKED